MFAFRKLIPVILMMKLCIIAACGEDECESIMNPLSGNYAGTTSCPAIRDGEFESMVMVTIENNDSVTLDLQNSNLITSTLDTIWKLKLNGNRIELSHNLSTTGALVNLSGTFICKNLTIVEQSASNSGELISCTFNGKVE